jgi:Guanylate kinase
MIAIIGESGSGKTTILNELVKRGFEQAINHTTRLRRENEKENSEYKFMTKREFNILWEENKLLQKAEFGNEYYGISVDSLKGNVACILNVDAIIDVKEKVKELGLESLKLKTFYIKVPQEIRRKRMLMRGESEEWLEKREKLDKQQFVDSEKIVDYIVENIDLQKAVNDIIKYYE